MPQSSSRPLRNRSCSRLRGVLLARYLKQQGLLEALNERVCLARRHVGRFEVIDAVAVLSGSAVSGERTLAASYERLPPWASAFPAHFERGGPPLV